MQDEFRQTAGSRRMRGAPGTWFLYALMFLGLTAAGLAALSMVFDGPPPRFDARLIQPGAVATILLFLLIYFASDGHLGLGGLDIFESNFNDGFSEP